MRVIRFMVAAALAALSAAPAGAHPLDPSGCGASAPVRVQCSTGWHAFDDTHDEAVISVFAYTGTVRSTLDYPADYPAGVWIFECSYLFGVAQRCSTYGVQPPAGTLVLHTCTSYLIPEIHGGAGEFACTLQ